MSFLRKKRFIFTSIAIIFIASMTSYSIFFKKNETLFETTTAKKQTLIQKVSITGRVKATEEVDLAFQDGGKIRKIFVKISDKVSEGQILAEVEDNELLALLSQSQSAVQSAEASMLQYEAALENQKVKLQELVRGTRSEEITIAETNVKNSKKTIEDAQKNLEAVTKTGNAELERLTQIKTQAELDLKNTKEAANTDIENLLKESANLLIDSFAKAKDSVERQPDEMFMNENLIGSTELSFNTSDIITETDVIRRRDELNVTLKDFKKYSDNAYNYSESELETALEQAKTYLLSIQTFLYKLTDALNYAIGLSQTSINTFRTNLSTAITNTNTALTNITNKQQEIKTQKENNSHNISTLEEKVNISEINKNNQEVTNENNALAAETKLHEAENALATAEADFNLKKAGSTAEQIASQKAQIKQAKATLASQEAQVKSAEAQVQNIEAQLAKKRILAPFKGIVTDTAVETGEIAAPNTPVISLISESLVQIETNVPEVDIAKLAPNNIAEITLDAYGSNTFFQGKIVHINPAESIIDGVATYKITIEFINPDERPKPGMTANIDVETARRENVIVVPQRAIIYENEKSYVLFKTENEESLKREVEVGIRGSEGEIEILSGLMEGEKIILSKKEQ
ncbi:efflux RND transporter periplasmic adaptor subunit [Candidatus Peregrinibacteria bacterium]|nr:efflux RND transporter periplasmic adaptor subunit [Candidatus Peregrinibacteria bacterium]